MNPRIALPLLGLVALIALIVGAVTGVVAVIVFSAIGLIVAIAGGIWAGRKVTPSSSGSGSDVSEL